MNINHLSLYGEIIAARSDIHTKYTNVLWGEKYKTFVSNSVLHKATNRLKGARESVLN
jgi:hypothetical protein